MNLTIDGNKFDKLQMLLIGAIIEEIKTELDSAGLPSAHVRNLLGKISFSVATVLDGSRSVGFEGNEISPVITFSEENALISGGGNSWMHEYVFGIIARHYEK